jgi:hypothetical protein
MGNGKRRNGFIRLIRRAAMDAAMVREDCDEMDERPADGGAGGLRGWIGTVYAVHPETPMVFDWNGETFTVGFGRDGADLRIRFSLAGVGHLVRFVGGTGGRARLMTWSRSARCSCGARMPAGGSSSDTGRRR